MQVIVKASNSHCVWDGRSGFFIWGRYSYKNITKRGATKMNQNQLHYGISLKLYFDNKAFGPGMSALLRGIEETGSLQGAAQSMNMAYSKAWKMLKESEKAWGFMLTDRETGGRDGGGSTLTPQAVRLLEAYDVFMKESRQELDRLFEKHFSREWVEELKKSSN
jgi:molybdate transport system regulatory protein